jgi:hypothetical protein
MIVANVISRAKFTLGSNLPNGPRGIPTMSQTCSFWSRLFVQLECPFAVLCPVKNEGLNFRRSYPCKAL